MAPVYQHELWKYAKRDRPWLHLRYHSSFPVPDATTPTFQTLHVIAVHNMDHKPGQPTFLLPHETNDSTRLPKTMLFSLETSSSQYFPQALDEVREIGIMLRRIAKRKASTSVERLDFWTRQPLEAVLTENELDVHLTELTFKPIPVRRTKAEITALRWDSTKKNREARKALDQEEV